MELGDRKVPKYNTYKNSDFEEILMWEGKFTNEETVVFIDLLVEIENFSPIRYITKKIYFF